MDVLKNYLNSLNELGKEIIVTGHLNCDFYLTQLQPHSRRLEDIFQLVQLKRMITEPLRVTSNKESLLDAIAY